MSDRTASPASSAADIPPASATRHPLLRVGKEMASDLLSTLVFVVLFAVTQSVTVSVSLAIAIGAVRIIYQRRRGIRIDAMQWLSLFLVIVFGGAALITQNPLFIMLKPTLIYTAIGVVMLRRGWMNRYVPPIVQTNAGELTILFGYLWAALMFATGATNLVVALNASHATWAWFIGVFPLASKLALVLVQYNVTGGIVRRRIRAAKLVAVPAV